MKDSNLKEYLFIGRFQPFHLGHLEVIKEILPQTKQLILGLGSTNQMISLHNPFSYRERKILLKHTLSRHLSAKNLKKIKLAPIPDTKSDLQRKNFIQKRHPKHLIVTGNSRVRDIFVDRVLWVPQRFKNISATQIRELFLRWDFDKALRYLPKWLDKFLPFFRSRFDRLKSLQKGI